MAVSGAEQAVINIRVRKKNRFIKSPYRTCLKLKSSRCLKRQRELLSNRLYGVAVAVAVGAAVVGDGVAEGAAVEAVGVADGAVVAVEVAAAADAL